MEHYNFPHEFQREILKLVLLDPTFLLKKRNAIHPAYFADEAHSWIAEAALTIFDVTRSAPTLGSLITAAGESCPGGLDPDEVEAEIRSIYAEGPSKDAAFTEAKVGIFAKQQRFNLALAGVGEKLERAEFEEVLSDLQEANRLSDDLSGEIYTYENDVKARMTALADLPKHVIPSGIPPVDARLLGGGLGPGELGVAVAFTGYHKSTFLVNVGMSARSLGLNVFHATFELSERRIANRYDSAISRMTLEDRVKRPEVAQKKIKSWIAERGGSLKIKWWPARSAGLSEIDAYLKWLEAEQDWVPDLLVVDYLSLMKYPSGHNPDNERYALREMFVEFNAYCGKRNIPGWTAHQANRESLDLMRRGKVLSLDNMAEGLDPCRVADVVVTLNQSPGDREDGILRIHGAKVRDYTAGWTESAKIDAALSVISDLGGGGEEDED